MADVVDKSQQEQEKVQEAQIEWARTKSVHRRGPKICHRCDDINDRAHQGYGICTECTNELNHNKATS